MAVKFRDYYEVLGVKRESTAKEIKSAYHKLARKWHPDLHAGADKEDAEEKIKKINEAYEVLSDPDKRAKYDQLGANWQGGQDFQPPPGMGGFEFHTTGGNAGDFSDFFEMLFGSGMGRGGTPFGRGGHRARRGPMKGQDVEAEIELTLEEVHRGVERSIQLSTGNELKTLSVKIPVGIGDGGKIRLKGQGGEGYYGGERGDLYLTARIVPHAMFRQSGSDLEVEITLRPEQAALGEKVTVPTLDGSLNMTVPAGARSGQKLRLRGKGLNAKSGPGDLYARIKIDLPGNLTPEELELYRKLAELRK